MVLTARYVCTVKHHDRVMLLPVQLNSEENGVFFRNNPGGEIDLQRVANMTAESFVVGKHYIVDFTEAEEQP